MPDKDKSAQKAIDPATAAITAMAEMQRAGLGSLAWMGAAYTERMSNMGSEVLQFLAERIAEDVKTQHQILHCKDAAELQQIQAAFLQKAIDQYTAETGKLVEMGNQLINDVVTAKPK